MKNVDLKNFEYLPWIQCSWYFFLDTTKSQVFFLGKSFIEVKSIASSLEVRKDNEEIRSIIERRENWKKIYIKNTYYWCDFFSFVSPSGDFTGHLRFWLQKYLVQNWRELFTRKKLTVIIFRNFMKLSRWERKMKIWENCNANGKMTKNKCVSYWTRDISSWSLEEKLHWYNITHGVNSSLSIQLWQGVTCPALRRTGVLRIASILH